MIKKILVVLAIVPIIVAGAYFAMNQKGLQFESVCDTSNKQYTKLCNNVGKNAYSSKSVININERNYGPILGVAWRRKDSLISSPGREKRYSKQNSYYYIIGSNNDSNYQFLRRVGEVVAK